MQAVIMAGGKGTRLAALTKDEIHFVIDGYVKGEIPDYQMSSLLMAIVLNGMSDKEIISLTDIFP